MSGVELVSAALREEHITHYNLRVLSGEKGVSYLPDDQAALVEPLMQLVELAYQGLLKGESAKTHRRVIRDHLAGLGVSVRLDIGAAAVNGLLQARAGSTGLVWPEERSTWSDGPGHLTSDGWRLGSRAGPAVGISLHEGESGVALVVWLNPGLAMRRSVNIVRPRDMSRLVDRADELRKEMQ